MDGVLRCNTDGRSTWLIEVEHEPKLFYFASFALSHSHLALLFAFFYKREGREKERGVAEKWGGGGGEERKRDGEK